MVRTPKGKVIRMYMQDISVKPLIEEVSLDHPITVLTLLTYMKEQDYGFLINEFQAKD